MATDDNINSPSPLPGYNLPYNHINEKRFASALDPLTQYTMPLTTLREFTMMRLMNQLTDKPNWSIKIFDDEITNKWRNEAFAAEDIDITQEMVDWCIDELRYKAKVFENTGMVTVYTGDVIKSDVAVPSTLRLSLINAVQQLENVPASERDWHPGSDEKVLDLVHPSLFPLVYGQTRIVPAGTTTLEDCIERTCEGTILQLNKDDDYDPFRDASDERYGFIDYNPLLFSEKFQWLPCEVDLSNDEPKITSYINNLHPRQHKHLYTIVEKIIGCAIPLWNESLTRQKTPEYRLPRVEYRTAIQEGGKSPRPEQGPDENIDDFYRRIDQWHEEELDRRAAQPEIKTFQLPNQDLFEEDGITLKSEFKVDLKREYGKIQVIVKLANIHLTPEKPKYEGGTWHVEGQLNEHICASALLYYSSDNITPSHLAFRQMINGGTCWGVVSYEQNYNRWMTDVFGCEGWGQAIQDIGSILTKEGRLITFPNILQHQVQPFELADPTKPGYRKIFALFLVDPNASVISTANVACQRKDWWREVIINNEEETLFEKLPPEVKDEIYEMVEDFPMSMEKAKELRLELMKERKAFVVRQDEFFTKVTFALCEH